VLLTATLAASSVIPLDVALGLVLGANLGSGLLAVLTTSRSAIEVRQVPLGNLVFKALGVLIAAPFVGLWLRHARPYLGEPATMVVLYHLVFNVMVGMLFIGFTQTVAGWVSEWLPIPDRTLASAAATPPGPVGTEPRRRWPSRARPARRCTRPTWSRP
jgi:phosphate:Na+ symporter